LENRVTEKRNPASIGIDQKTVPEILEIINNEDSRITEAISRELEPIGKAVKLIIKTLKRGGTVYFVGSGTSGRIGVLEAAELPPTFGVSPDRFQAIIAGGKRAVFKAIEVAEDSEIEGCKIIQAAEVGPEDLLIGITASGSTPFVIGAIMQGALTICNSYKEFLGPVDEVYLSGGGSRNPHLVSRIKENLEGVKVMDYSVLGFPSEAKEAVLMALLANEYIMNTPSNIPAATGANQKVRLGVLYNPPYI